MNFAAHEQVLLSSGVREVFSSKVGELSQKEEALFSLVGADDSMDWKVLPSGALAVEEVLFSTYWNVCREQGKTQILASCLEDAPTMRALKRLEELGCLVRMIPVKESGLVDLDFLEAKLNPKVALITMGVASALTGLIQPVDLVLEMAQKKSVLVHLEASYAVGKYRFAMPDFLTFRGEMIHGPFSSGVLFHRKEAPFELIHFVKKDPYLLAALSRAAAHAELSMDRYGLEITHLRDQLEETVLQKIPSTTVLFQEALRLPNTSVLVFDRIDAEALQDCLELKEIRIDLGGHYTQTLKGLLDHSKIEGRGAVSLSLDRMAESAALQKGTELLIQEVAHLQRLSEDL